MLGNLDTVLGDTSGRVRLAAGLVAILWLGVAWAHWAPTTKPEAAAGPPTYELRLLVAEGQPSPAGGMFDRFVHLMLRRLQAKLRARTSGKQPPPDKAA